MDYQDICRLFRSFSGRHIYVGYSGGADSLAALLAARYAAAESGAPLTAVHFDHGLRGAESEADADHCRKQCREWHVEFRLIPLQVSEKIQPGESVETAARRLRLEAWRKILGNAAEQSVIVLGHHKNDAEENFFLRLARGAGIGGLYGLRQVTCVENMTFLRPLLPFSRREIEDFLHQNSMEQWCCDRTNEQTDYRRNFVRHKILPLFRNLHPGASAGLEASMAAAAEAADFLESEADKRMAEFAADAWSAAQWSALPAALQPLILQKKISDKLGRHWVPRRGLILRFREMLDAPENPELRKLLLPDAPELQIHFRQNCLKLVQSSPQKHCRMWHWRENDDILLEVKWVSEMPEPEAIPLHKAYFDAEKLPDELWISDGTDGDRMCVYGGREIKWKKLRIDRGIAREDAAPLLRKPDGTILWSPGIRHGNEACVDKKSVHIVEFTYKEPQNGNSKTNYGTSA